MTVAVAGETVVRFEARGAAKDFLEYQGPEVCLSGPAGSGKTVAALMKLHLTALAVPGLRALVLRQTHASLTATTLATFDHLVAKDALATGIVSWYGGSARRPASYDYGNGSSILVGGLDRGPEKWLSLEVDRVFIDEAVMVTETDVETLLTRLRGKAPTYKQLAMATNPSSPTNWLYQRCTAKGITKILYSTYRDNPYFTHADGSLTEAGVDYMAKLQGLTGIRRKRLLDGIWCAAEGIVFEEFDPAVHVVDHAEIPPGWTRWWGIDFGYVNPTVVQWFAQDGDGRLWLYREIVHTGKTVDQIAADIRAQVIDANGQWREPKPRAIVCDHDAEGRAVLERELGMSTVAAHKAVTEGIQAVQARLRPAGDGRPRLLLMRDAVVRRDRAMVESKKPIGAAEEISSYVWDTGAGKSVKETPLKVDDHSMDALRYVVAAVDLGGRPRMRWLG